MSLIKIILFVAIFALAMIWALDKYTYRIYLYFKEKYSDIVSRVLCFMYIHLGAHLFAYLSLQSIDTTAYPFFILHMPIAAMVSVLGYRLTIGGAIITTDYIIQQPIWWNNSIGKLLYQQAVQVHLNPAMNRSLLQLSKRQAAKRVNEVKSRLINDIAESDYERILIKSHLIKHKDIARVKALKNVRSVEVTALAKRPYRLLTRFTNLMTGTRIDLNKQWHCMAITLHTSTRNCNPVFQRE